jgi:TolA-binding protein
MSRCSRLRRALVFLVGTAAAALMLGCGPTADTQQAQADQSALRGMLANDQQQIDALQEKVQRLDDRIAELEHNGPASGGSHDVGDLAKRVAKLESETSSGQTPGAVPTPGAGSPEGSEEAAVPGGPAAAAGSAAPESEGSTEASSGIGSSAPPASGPSWRTLLDQEITASHNDPAAKLYRGGLIALKASKYEQALAQFQTLQRRYPKSSLSEAAEFFSANALYEMGKYDQSILQFNDQTMRFPKGPFASAALLREAQAFVKINDRIDARLTLQKLLNDLPDSPEAPMAKSMMQTLAS